MKANKTGTMYDHGIASKLYRWKAGSWGETSRLPGSSGCQAHLEISTSKPIQQRNANTIIASVYKRQLRH